MAQDQLAIIGPNVKDTSPYCKDTLQIHVLKNNHCNEKPFLHYSKRFQTEMKEKQENHVKIEDIEANIFQEFLRYVYTNTVNDLNTHAEELYAAADKYDLPKLKSICIDELSRSLNSENAIHMFLFSDENNVTILKDRTMEFIKKHMNLIFQTEGYKSLCQSPKAYFIQEIFQATFDYLNALIYS
ncbi:speckle-type POZ protein-like isoform X2 [Belonocnema kinseyi]|uniref:speckle-type POZ protein-like isoform X2 n=1 Tax=Belonocnema kinseyi TaxID=2817044 RepID=UPI00143D7985|nr:speckle-type POZ protein-like isoform X2 [Belonocnema kinseyi]